MLIKVGIVILVLLAGLLVWVALQPSDFEISRELAIKAAPEKLFPYINNSQKSNDWMPWIETDPALKMSYSGPAEGVGSRSSWESTGQMGFGQAEVVESVPNQLVKTKLTYTKPMVMEQLAEMSLTPKGTETIVKWKVTGKNNFIGRFACMFINMDKMVGGNFEKGLTKLKTIVE